MTTTAPTWLSDAIFYEVYPQSFLDTNGDGIGDLPGVIRKLDYIQSLGCTAIWLNPCFESPFGDAGYDVSDFRKVAARYGTNEDLVRLFDQAHRRGMKVCLDLVAGHTSVEHPWFQASAEPESNAYSNWYVWTDCPWTESTRELPLIRGYSDRGAAYMPNYFHFQPALNYGFQNRTEPWHLPTDHPDVLALREEMKDIMRFWMDQGADGFRVDMAFSLVKNDPDFVGTKAFWKDMRDMFDREYPECALIAEWSSPRDSLPAGFHLDFMIHFNNDAYLSLTRDECRRDGFQTPGTRYGDSYFDKSGQGDIKRFLRHYLEHFQATRGIGHISLPTGNHDLTRLCCDRSVADLKVVFAFLWTMPGVPYLYMGDEIGMRYIPDLPSKEGGFGRTGARTPMQWNGKRNAGFSTAGRDRLYIPLDPRDDRPTVEAQDGKPASLLTHVRALSRLRHETPALQAEGDFEVVYSEQNGYPFAYLRGEGAARVLVVLNPADQPVEVTLDLALVSTRPLRQSGTRLIPGKKRCALQMKGRSFGIFKVELKA